MGKPAEGFIRDPEGTLDGHYRSATDALMVAIAELKATGGGTVWIHRPDCDDEGGDEQCPCHPVPLIVESDLVN